MKCLSENGKIADERKGEMKSPFVKQQERDRERANTLMRNYNQVAKLVTRNETAKLGY